MEAGEATQKIRHLWWGWANWRAKWVIHVTLWWQAACHRRPLCLSPQEGLTLTRGTRLSPASPLLWLCACLCMLYVCTSLNLPVSRLAASQVSFLWVVFVLTSFIYYMTWCNSTGLRWSRTDSCKLSLRTHAEKPAFSYSQNLLSVLKELHVQTCFPS